MLRDQLNGALKDAMKAKDATATSALRLILAALKDRDIAARTKGGSGASEGLGDEEILGLLQSMIKQRRESIEMYEKGGRAELAQQEAREIEIIQGFLPAQMSADEMAAAIDAVLAETGADSIKDMGRVMGALKERHAGAMDFSQASKQIKERLM